MPAEKNIVYTVQSIEGPQIYADDAEPLRAAIDNAGTALSSPRDPKLCARDATVTIPAGKTVAADLDGGKNLHSCDHQNFRARYFQKSRRARR